MINNSKEILDKIFDSYKPSGISELFYFYVEISEPEYCDLYEFLTYLFSVGNGVRIHKSNSLLYAGREALFSRDIDKKTLYYKNPTLIKEIVRRYGDRE